VGQCSRCVAHGGKRDATKRATPRALR
jgi:hypothetical protein